MAESNDPLSVRLPEKLRRQFEELERRLWKVETAVALAGAFSALIISYLVLFFSDRLWDSPFWLRGVVAIAAVLAVLGALYVWAWRWFLKRRDLRALARIVQRRHRRLGDRLLGIVELSNESNRPAHFSPELYRAAIQQVATEAGQYDFGASVETRPARRLSMISIGLAAFVAVPALLFPAAAFNTFQRWIAPAAQIERYTLVALHDFPEKLVVAHGETFEIAGTIEYRSFWRPGRALGQYERQPRVEGRRTDDLVRFEVPGQVETGRFAVRLGDARREIRVEPSYRPSLRELTASVQLPEYLRQPEALNESVQNGALTVIEGSRVSFAGSANRELALALMHADGGTPHELEVRGESFSTELVEPSGLSRFAFTWRDRLGLNTAAPLQLTVQTRRDAPPIPELPGLPREVALLESELLEIRVLARDDFGVSDFGLSWDFASELDQHHSIASTEVRVEVGSPDQKQVEDVFQWSPRMFRIPSDTTIELQAYARDFLPGRERVETPVYRIHVLGRERHAELVRQRLENLLARVEEVTRLEEKILSQTIEASNPAQLDAPENQAQVAQIKDMQLQNAAQLEQLAKEGMELLREAMRNPGFTENTLEQWARNLQQMQQISQDQMQQAASSLDAAQQQQGSDERAGHLAEALQTEQDILEALERLQGRVNEDLDNLQAMTLAQRLRKLGFVQQELEQDLMAVLPETIGLLPQELGEPFQKLNAYVAGEQELTQAEAQQLQGEIHRFFERTRKENYGEVSQAMSEARTGDELERIRSLILDNVGMEASRNLASWSERFGEWADKLEPPMSEDAGGGGGEGGGESSLQDVTKQLIALLRVREKELTLHRQTRLLDGQKGSPEDYENRARVLARDQSEIHEEMRGIQRELDVDVLDEIFEEASGAMGEVETYLGKPQTDEGPQQAQIEAVETLTDIINLINEQAQRSPPPEGGGGSAEDLAFLMQMMAPGLAQGMEVGDEGGGSSAGGDTSRPVSPVEGDATGTPGQERRINRASGAVNNLPVEFRETLENYFRAIEQEGR